MINKNVVVVCAALAVAAAAARGADCVAERATPAAPEPAATDDTMELKWDSGFRWWCLCWYTGADTWVGNDFDITTISSYAAIQAIRFQSRTDWPNVGWDGFRLGIFSFSGGVPGSLLWGPKFVMPAGSTGWKEFSVNWTLPSGVYKFTAAQEQFYNFPGCDPFFTDNNTTFLRHSWMYIRGAWSPFESSYALPYRNLMLRVIVNNSTLAITPVSIGRVKALYY